jgi:hypothetical protein
VDEIKSCDTEFFVFRLPTTRREEEVPMEFFSANVVGDDRVTAM